jgi:hypothetical protein
VGLVRIEVVIIAVVDLGILIRVNSFVFSIGGKINTVYQKYISFLCTLTVVYRKLRGAMSLTIYKIEDRPHRLCHR